MDVNALLSGLTKVAASKVVGPGAFESMTAGPRPGAAVKTPSATATASAQSAGPMRQKVQAAGGMDRFMARKGRQAQIAATKAAPPPISLTKTPVSQLLSRGAQGVAKGIQGLPSAISRSLGRGGALRQSIAYSGVPALLGKVMETRQQRQAAAGKGAQTPEQVRAQRQQVGGVTSGRFR